MTYPARVSSHQRLMDEIDTDARLNRIRVTVLRAIRRMGLPEYVPSEDVQPARLTGI